MDAPALKTRDPGAGSDDSAAAFIVKHDCAAVTQVEVSRPAWPRL